MNFGGYCAIQLFIIVHELGTLKKLHEHDMFFTVHQWFMNVHEQWSPIVYINIHENPSNDFVHEHSSNMNSPTIHFSRSKWLPDMMSKSKCALWFCWKIVRSRHFGGIYEGNCVRVNGRDIVYHKKGRSKGAIQEERHKSWTKPAWPGMLPNQNHILEE
jgi:hypothetical protein